MTDEAQDSQQTPQQDSALQTPQPDQPHPPVQQTPQPDERSDQSRTESADADRADDSPPVEVNVNIDNPAAPATDRGD